MLADICVLLMVAFFIWSGYRSGLMRALIKVVSYVLSIIISVLLYPVVSDYLTKTVLYEKIVDFISAKYIQGSVAGVDGNAFGGLGKYLGEGLAAATNGISEGIATLFVNVLAFFIILFLSKILIRIIGNALGIFTKLPVIKQFNRLGGGVLGGIIGIFAVYVLAAVLVAFTPIDLQKKVEAEVENSVFASEIYENNIVLNFIGKGK
jgi:uncharacterized membrane protein required for colicin V production